MAGPSEELRTRVLPALLTAFGVTILSAGLLTYTVPVAPAPSQEPGPTPAASAAVVPTATPLITLPPIGTPRPTESASPRPTATPPPKGRVATRVRIRDLGVDLAVVVPSGAAGEVTREDVVRHASQASVFRNIETPEWPAVREETIAVSAPAPAVAEPRPAPEASEEREESIPYGR